MKYDNEFVKRIVDSPASGRKVQETLGVSRKTVYRWRNRNRQGLPFRFKRRAKRVWNKTRKHIQKKIKHLLKETESTIQAWCKFRKVCLRTVQRYKKQWFPQQPKPKPKIKRYERKHVFSLMHTDWGVKRIKNGIRCCFSFYEDDCSRKLFALKAYKKADLTNTLDNQKQAKKETHGFKAVLSDNARVYKSKKFDEQLGNIKHIKTRPYNPKCNGKAENIVKKVKQFLNKFEVQSIKHANQLLKQFKKEYNKKPHSSLKYHTPNQIFRNKQKKES
ncbi:DDE-type integrase/transposase/recombinase [Candidatus Micrarchaeota archaeon]|nr:DDE-type integrase/transposase/recombinase [Candidatus Micrarchaeota archaeon]